MLETFGKLGENLLKYIDLIKSNLFPISATLSIFTLLIIFLPESIFSSLHTDEFRNNYMAFIGAIAVVSTFLTFLLPLYSLLAKSYIFVRGMFFVLSGLTPDECSRLNHFIRNKSLTATFNTTDGVVYMLQDKGLIYQARSEMVKAHYEQDFHMYKWIYSRLIKHPELFFDISENEKENQYEHE